MVAQRETETHEDVIYPESDGKPMADNTKQFRWITVLYHNLDWLFADNPDVFVAGDLLWYPVKGDISVCQAPDVMVVFGAAKGDRGSYIQHKENDIAPQVVFEILSPGNTKKEMNEKLRFYNRYGVEEYYLYSPNRNTLRGWVRSSKSLEPIEAIDNWVSPRVGIRFEKSEEELQLYRPDGERFATYSEISQQLETALQLVDIAEQRADTERQRADTERQRADTERQRADTERQRANTERQRADAERLRVERLAEQLRSLGIDPEGIN